MRASDGIRAIRARGSFLLVVAATAALWVTVAGLQFKWTKELSSATEVHMGGNLQSLMTQWHRDFYDELSAICIALQVGPDSGAHDGWNDYLQRYADWSEDREGNQSKGSSFFEMGLAKEIYEWNTSGFSEPELLRLDPGGKTLDPVPVSADLKMLLTRLAENSASREVALRAWEYWEPGTIREKDSRTDPLLGWQLDDRVPALVHPVLHHADPFNSQTPVDRERVDWIVVVLNLDVIQKRILPELARRHFGGPDGLEYRVAVIDTDSNPRVIYSSDPNLRVEDVMDFDSIMDIFSSQPDMMKSEFWQALKNRRNLREETWRNFSPAGWFKVMQYGTVQHGTLDDPWVLVLQHRSQPIGGIAKTLWRRNLFIGGASLLLLAVNIGVILVEIHRAKKFAKAQMEFVASTSHELLTPLAAIYCSGQNAKDGLLRTKEDLVAHGSIVTTQARQLIDLVKQNLLFASTRSGSQRFAMRSLQVPAILEQLQENVAILVEQSKCKVRYEIAAELPSVRGDAFALTQCLQNLISNAIKYGEKGGEIEVRAALRQATDQNREVRISVSDHGPGMNAEEQRRIFAPFYRTRQAVESQAHGSGLGLAVASSIAEAMGGKLTIESELGTGSTFTLILPVEESPSEVPADAAETEMNVKS
ncbi:MAG TPA: HAMP domain-containing sensor histidine kinase [Dongiaceae bacterium]|nr:HAMP domain-containing sensor histidine kinase [Dongiaceae bacterium]